MNIEIRKVSKTDVDLVFEWSNDAITRQNSFNPKTITKEVHYDWFFKKIKDPNTQMYILTNKNVPIGLVRFEIGQNVIIGVNVAPTERGKGLGTKLIKVGCDAFWVNSDQDILAFIKLTNTQSLKAFEKAGFILMEITEYGSELCFLLKAVKNGN